jgi:hypothetical protein
MNRPFHLASLCLLLASCQSVSSASPKQPDARSKLEAAISLAIAQAGEFCFQQIDESELTVAIFDSDYKISLQVIGNVRGGGAEVLIDRASSEVKEVTCSQ